MEEEEEQQPQPQQRTAAKLDLLVQYSTELVSQLTLYLEEHVPRSGSSVSPLSAPTLFFPLLLLSEGTSLRAEYAVRIYVSSFFPGPLLSNSRQGSREKQKKKEEKLKRERGESNQRRRRGGELSGKKRRKRILLFGTYWTGHVATSTR